MTNDNFNMQVAVRRLSTGKLAVYLQERGWQEKTSRYRDRIYFEGAVHQGGKPYQLHLPASRDVPRYRTLLQRAIYFLCDVEDREPSEIIRDILAAADD